MRSRTIFLNVALILLLFCTGLNATARASDTSSHFKTEIDFGNGSLFSTFLDVVMNRDHFTITSPPNADLRVIGSKAKLGRILGKAPKGGTLIRIRGTRKADSLFGETKIPVFGRLSFRGAMKDDVLAGELLNSESKPVGTVRGTRSVENKGHYDTLCSQLLKTVTDNIYSKSVLQTDGWRRFEHSLRTLCKDAHDDIEIFFGFNILARKLPFTHLSLVITQYDTTETEDDTASMPKSVFFEERNSTTAYLQIRNFSSSERELNAILPKIVSNPAYKNLIIDLRNNGGGGVGPAFALAKYIVTENQEVGYFVTNKLAYSGFQPELFKALPAVQPKSTAAFGAHLKSSPGAKLVFKKPENPVFSGHVYVLTNGRTGSTCEPMVYALKNAPNATVIGERTYGGMLAASPFTIAGKYLLMVPIADFYTYDGVRLDKVGVEPDIKVKSDDAEAKALELISGGSNKK